MTTLLWAAFGMSAGAAVLNVALGFGRPLDRTYLLFAGVMACLAIYLFFEWELYRSSTPAEAIEAMRSQLIAAHVFLGLVLTFVPSYTRVPIPRGVAIVFWCVLSVVFVANLVLPYGVWFSAPPALVPLTFAGEPYTGVVAPPMSWVQYVHSGFVLAVFVLVFRCAVLLYRSGARQRGAMLAFSIVVVLIPHAIDLVREAVGGTWLYIAEFGVVAWGLTMSIQLAIDFRNSELRLQKTLAKAELHAAELTRTVEATLKVRDTINTPLQTLELGLALRAARTPEDEATLDELRRAVTELTRLGRAVEQTTNQHWRQPLLDLSPKPREEPAS